MIRLGLGQGHQARVGQVTKHGIGLPSDRVLSSYTCASYPKYRYKLARRVLERVSAPASYEA